VGDKRREKCDGFLRLVFAIGENSAEKLLLLWGKLAVWGSGGWRYFCTVTAVGGGACGVLIEKRFHL
jgi:hypothetical protein